MMRQTLIAVAVLALASWAGAADRLAEELADLKGVPFVLDRIDDQAVPGEGEIRLEFDKGRISGSVCNRFHGGYEIRDGLLVADALATTRMLCPDEARGKLESLLLRQLRDGLSVSIADDVLILRRDETIWRFRRAAPAEGDTAAAPEAREAESPSWSDLADREFTLATVNGEAFTISMGRQPTITFFDDGRVSGNACNNFTGVGTLEEGELRVENAASTLMFCVDGALNEFERDFHKLLREGAAISLDSGRLTLAGEGFVCVFQEE